MNYHEAKQTLLKHNHGLEACPDNFLATLRPYLGLDEGHLLELLEALIVLAPHLSAPADVDRQIVYSLWDTCRTARAWTRGPHEPMFHGRHFITPTDKLVLDDWIDEIESMTLSLLRGLDVKHASVRAALLVLRRGLCGRAVFLVPTLTEALTYMLNEEAETTDIDDAVTVCQVLGAMGSAATQAVAALEQVRLVTRFPEMRAAIDAALSRIRE